MRIGLFGGSFNPPHNAHIQLCTYAKKAAFLDKVILIPTGDNPLKYGDDNIAREHRLKMTQLAVEDLPGFEVSDIEIIREGQSYTIDTVKKLKQNSSDDLFFISGSDILFQLTWWKNFRGLAALIDFICIARKGTDNTALLEEAEKINTLFHPSIILMESDTPDRISSSDIRTQLAEHKNCEQFIPEKVVRYIKKNNLYKAGTTK